MENKKEKCSYSEHKEIEANYYCFICNVYMCHKCESFHSKLCQHHKVMNYNELKAKELFTGFCKEENHRTELDYFCKDHNKLVCAKCIVKIHDKNKGKHSECNICSIDEIKNEKIDNLKNNINILENLSKTLDESINNIKKILENVNEKKEELKMKVQKLFTKIRNELNIREEKLLNDIDDFFDKNFFKEENIKEYEKLPNRIKTSLEKNKNIKNENNMDINTIINNCILVENNIKDVNNLKDLIEKSNNSSNQKIILLPESEDEINKILQTIQSLGKISLFSEKFLFKFRPNLSSNYNLSGNSLIATKKGLDEWDCAILGDQEIPKNALSKWKIRLNKISDYRLNSWSILIGIGPKYDGTKNFHHKCYSFICGECSFNIKNKVSKSNLNKARLKSGSVIEIIVDRTKGYISFVVNGNEAGVACKEIPKDDILYPFVSMYDTEQIVEIVE